MTSSFMTAAEIMAWAGCGRTKANQIKKAVNDEALKRGYKVWNVRTCSKELLMEMTGGTNETRLEERGGRCS